MQNPNSSSNSPMKQNIKIPSSNSQKNDHTNPQVKYVHKVQVKGKISGTNSKTIEIHPHSNKLIVYGNDEDKQKGKGKQYPLNQVTFSHQKRQTQGKKDCLDIDTNNGKKYAIRGDNSALIAEHIQKGQTLYQINQFKQQQVNMVPKQVNYVTPLQSGLNQFQKILLPPNQTIFNQQFPVIQPKLDQLQPTEDYSKYPRKKFYFDPQDWAIDKQKGKVVFINEQKKKSQSKVIGWVIKKFLTTGSFMGISFPTFVMKSQSILQSYAKAIGAAPFLLDNVTNPVERMKNIICLIHSFSLVFCDMTKPFNPPLGQTFQAKIANGNYYAQQVNHHPPISAFLFEGKNYKISGCMQMTASIGPNTAKGLFVGDLKVQFNDGMIYTGRIPGGDFSGFLIGDHKFEAYGTIYCYNNKKLFCSINSTHKQHNFFIGYIGKLKPKYQQEFFAKVTSPDRFSKFPFYDRKCFDTVFSSMDMGYNSRTCFDQREYFNLTDQKYLPFLPQPIDNQKLLLKSDSRFRKDIPLRAQLKFDEAQKEKQKLEQQERHFRKLRAKYDPLHHKDA